MQLFVRALTCAIVAVSVLSPAVAREVKTLPALSVVTYQKICEDFGCLTNGWKLTSALAYNGTADVSWIATSNRACTAANMDAGTATRGELPSGPYVHVLAAVAQWDGTRTRSLRVQFAQPAGSRDLYARVVAVTVSQPGKNLLHVEDLYNLKDDKTLVESDSTKAADLQTCPVKAVRLEEKAGYIESAGDLRVNTGYCIGPTTRIELDFQMTEVANLVRLFGMKGVKDDPAQPQCDCYIGADSQGVRKFSFIGSKADGSQQAINLYPADLDRHTIIVDFAAESEQFKVLTDGEVVGSKTFAAFPSARSPYPLAFFAKNYTTHGLYSPIADTILYPSKMKVYGFRLYESGNLVRNFTPCVKGGVAGFKELCTGFFFTGDDIMAGTAGGDVLEEMDDPYIASPDNWIDGAAGKSVYLDTGYAVGPGTRVELDYALLTPDWETNNLYKATDKNPNPFLLDASSASSMGIYLYGGSATAGYYAYQLGTGSGDLTELRLNTAYGVRRTVVMDSNTVTVVTSGFTNFVKSVAAGKELKTTLNTLKIASRNNLSRFLPVRVYGLRIYEDGGLLKDYRPFVKDMKPGLVNALDETDRIHTSTYSSKGVRTDVLFTPGGAISGDESLAGAYLEFDSVHAHNINTGHIVTKDTCIEIDLALWCTDNTTQQFYFEQRGYKSTPADCNGVWARLYMNSDSKFAYQFMDYPSAFTGSAMFAVNQERTKFKFDAYNNMVSAERGGETVFNQTMVGTRTATTCTSPLYIGSNWSGSLNSGLMRLYGFKISEAGTVAHNYVPYRRGAEVGLYDVVGDGGFLPLAGGRVSGANTGADEFQVFPQDTKLEIAGTDTLRCLAAGAVSYRWYCNGILLPDETGETLTVVWRKGKPRTDIYAVVPVYEVYCNPVLGARATATVEYSVSGMSIFLR